MNADTNILGVLFAQLLVLDDQLAEELDALEAVGQPLADLAALGDTSATAPVHALIQTTATTQEPFGPRLLHALSQQPLAEKPLECTLLNTFITRHL